jgi:hypothetical protein
VPANRRDAWRIHKLEGDDTFISLARRYNTTAALVSSVNHDALPEAGSLVVIPASYPGDRIPVRSAVRTTTRSRTSSRRPAVSSSRVKPSTKPGTRASAPRAKTPTKASAAAPAKTPTKASASKGVTGRAG